MSSKGFTWRGRFYPVIAGGDGTGDGATQGTGDAAQSAGNAGQGAGGKTFTQAELDAIIEQRLGRERSKYADYEDLKRAKGELDQIRAGQLSEMEKISKRASDAETRAQAAEARLKETVTRLEVERAARKLEIVDEDAAYRLLDAGRIEYDEAGQPTNIEPLLKDLLRAKPYLAAKQTAPPIGATNPARGGGSDAGDPFTAALYRGAGLEPPK